MEIDEKVFRELKEKFTKEPVLAALYLDKKNEDRSGCIRLCNIRGIIYGIQRQEMTARSIPLKISK